MGIKQGLSCKRCVSKGRYSGRGLFILVQRRIEVMERRGGRCKRLLDDLRERSCYWKLKREALDRTLSRTRSRRNYGPVVRQTAW